MKKYPTQQEIIDKMANGWELGSGLSARDTRVWLQFGGIGRGGESIDVHSNTLHALLKKHLIKQLYSFPSSTYSLVGDKDANR